MYSVILMLAMNTPAQNTFVVTDAPKAGCTGQVQAAAPQANGCQGSRSVMNGYALVPMQFSAPAPEVQANSCNGGSGGVGLFGGHARRVERRHARQTARHSSGVSSSFQSFESTPMQSFQVVDAGPPQSTFNCPEPQRSAPIRSFFFGPACNGPNCPRFG